MSITVNGINTTLDELEQKYENIKLNLSISKDEKAMLDTIFSVALLDPNQFRNIKRTSITTISEYLEYWCDNFLNSLRNPPSKKIANPKGSPSDPSIKEMVKKFHNLDDDAATYAEHMHDLFMSAENKQGGLLEEYIYQKSKKYDWVWCAGESLRAIDFCKFSNNRQRLIQVKNKFNTENSSSSKIRNGTTITKWFRVKMRKVNGVPYAIFQWDELNKLMGMPSDDLFSEDDYQQFLIQCIENNPNLL